MQDNYEKFFSAVSAPKTPHGLIAKIIQRIDQVESIRAVRRRCLIFVSILCTALSAAVPLASYAKAEFANSGFLDFFSLGFSDSEIVLQHWEDFLLALVESLPVISTVLILTIMFIALQSLRYVVRDSRAFFKPLTV